MKKKGGNEDCERQRCTFLTTNKVLNIYHKPLQPEATFSSHLTTPCVTARVKWPHLTDVTVYCPHTMYDTEIEENRLCRCKLFSQADMLKMSELVRIWNAIRTNFHVCWRAWNVFATYTKSNWTRGCLFNGCMPSNRKLLNTEITELRRWWQVFFYCNQNKSTLNWLHPLYTSV